MKRLFSVFCCVCALSFSAQAQYLRLKQPQGETRYLEQQIKDKEQRNRVQNANPPVRKSMRHMSRQDPRKLTPHPRVNRIEKSRDQTYTAVPVAPVYHGGN